MLHSSQPWLVVVWTRQTIPESGQAIPTSFRFWSAVEARPRDAGGRNFGSFTTPAMNAEGQIAFLANLFVPRVGRDGVIIGGPGGGVTASNDFGLWATDRNGTLHSLRVRAICLRSLHRIFAQSIISHSWSVE